MIRVSQLRLRPDQGREQLKAALLRKLRIREDQLKSMEVVRKSLDARKKPKLYEVYTVQAETEGEDKLLKRFAKGPDISSGRPVVWQGPGQPGEEAQPLAVRPVIIGSGPAGLFCALVLARAGYRPLLFERGEAMEERTQSVEAFWEGKSLKPDSNVQFGEGGAGTFSDGKLNTGIKDSSGRIAFVLRTFVQAGADPDILSGYKPHIGTDVLRMVIVRIREEIRSLGGTFLFSHLVEEIRPEGKAIHPGGVDRGGAQAPGGREREGEKSGASPLWRLRIRDLKAGRSFDYLAQVVVAAPGHSARDTFFMLQEQGFVLSAKAFAAGVRIQHPQRLINSALYGEDCPYELPAAPYKLACKIDGEGVYSFCMCPGGYIVDASSEEGRLAVNGMSYHGRAGEAANSAIVVTISPQQYGDGSPLSGIQFQRELEEKAYRAGRGHIPVQTFAEFAAAGREKAYPDSRIRHGRTPSLAEPAAAGKENGKSTDSLWHGANLPQTKGKCTPANVRGIFPEEMARRIEAGIRHFDRGIPGFAADDALLFGVESRTSSPVRIERTQELYAVDRPGFYPCGEGAGYAGGITSAAVDGIRVAEAVVKNFRIS